MSDINTDVWRRRPIEPRFHDTVTLVGQEGGIRVLVTEDGIVYSLYEFVERHRDKSPEWQRKTVRAVGLLYDFYCALPPLAGLAGQRQFLSKYIETLLAGTVDFESSDPLGLFWPPQTRDAVREVITYLIPFLDYVLDASGGNTLNPLIAASFGERMAAFRRFDKQNNHSLLQHLGLADTARMRAQFVRMHEPPRRHNVMAARPPAFPSEHLGPLLWEGFAQRGASETDPPWDRWHLRDQLLAVLGAGGGVRASDALHLFTTDVTEDPARHGVAEVRLYHPVDGAAPLHRKLGTRTTERPTRTEYLNARFGLKPRTQLTGAERVGWKNLLLEVGAPHYYTTVHWLTSDWGQLFWQLYKLYVRNVLPRGLNHPYLFVNLTTHCKSDIGKPIFGEPYRLASYVGIDGAFARAVQVIGLEPRKGTGTTSHGLRHAYAQILNSAGIDVKIIQICLHHKSPDSQAVYTQIGAAGVNRALEIARSSLDILSNVPMALKEPS